MSVPERHLVLSPAALDDLTDILQFSLATWGEEQMVTYSQMLDSRLSMIWRTLMSGFSGLPYLSITALPLQASI